jgi:hypothetical protein
LTEFELPARLAQPEFFIRGEYRHDQHPAAVEGQSQVVVSIPREVVADRASRLRNGSRALHLKIEVPAGLVKSLPAAIHRVQ